MTAPEQAAPGPPERGEATLYRVSADTLAQLQRQLDEWERGVHREMYAPAYTNFLIVLEAEATRIAANPRIYGPLGPRVTALQARYDALVANG